MCLILLIEDATFHMTMAAIQTLTLLDGVLHALVHLLVEKDGTEPAQDGERQVDIDVREAFPVFIVRLLEHDAKGDGRVQGAQVIVGTRDKKHGSKVS